MKTLFVTFSVLIVTTFGGAIITGDASAKAFVIHIHDRAATIQTNAIKVGVVEREVVTYNI